MPFEYKLLRYARVPIESCPKCGARPFDPFLRGQVHRGPIRQICIELWRRLHGNCEPVGYCALICWTCKEIVGYESPAEGE